MIRNGSGFATTRLIWLCGLRLVGAARNRETGATGEGVLRAILGRSGSQRRPTPRAST